MCMLCSECQLHLFPSSAWTHKKTSSLVRTKDSSRRVVRLQPPAASGRPCTPQGRQTSVPVRWTSAAPPSGTTTMSPPVGSTFLRQSRRAFHSTGPTRGSFQGRIGDTYETRSQGRAAMASGADSTPSDGRWPSPSREEPASCIRDHGCC